ncbi:Na+/H+ antiporter NhaA [Georgenia muralis]
MSAAEGRTAEALRSEVEAPRKVPASPRTVLSRLTPGGGRNFADTLRAENTGAVLLVLGTVAALVLANSPARSLYGAISGAVVGPAALHLDLTLAQWATDGLLAIFFFVVGLELKREMVEGQLRRPATAIVPILAAVGGMAVPALLYLLVNVLAEDGDPGGWAVPVATDIAFAVAVLTLFGRRLPTALRAFLLTLAVVDDLLGIVVIALFYSGGIHLLELVGALAAIAAFGLLVRRRRSPVWLLPLVAVVAWALMHLTRARLDASVRWPDLDAVSVVAGIGFTVSLLIGELSFSGGSPRGEHVKAAILLASAGAAIVSGLLLTWRGRAYSRHDASVGRVPAPLDEEHLLYRHQR